MIRTGPWTLVLDVGLPPGRDLVDMADLDNYAYPLATRLRTEDLVSVWCTKRHAATSRSEEHTSELQSLMRISYAVFCLKKKKKVTNTTKVQYRQTKTKQQAQK